MPVRVRVGGIGIKCVHGVVDGGYDNNVSHAHGGHIDARDEGLHINLIVNGLGEKQSEVRSLYVAAAILQREGIPTTLLRAGKDYSPFLGPDESWASEISIDLGYTNHVEVPKILALADFLKALVGLSTSANGIHEELLKQANSRDPTERFPYY